MNKELKDLAQKWREYIEVGTNVRPLAASTVMSKINKGSTYPDIPLIDTGEMIASIDSEAIALDDINLQGSIFATDPKFIWHEYGLGVPERPTIRPVFDNNVDGIVDRVFDSYFEIVREKFKRG